MVEITIPSNVESQMGENRSVVEESGRAEVNR
jgi:hypothetical protein